MVIKYGANNKDTVLTGPSQGYCPWMRCAVYGNASAGLGPGTVFHLDPALMAGVVLIVHIALGFIINKLFEKVTRKMFTAGGRRKKIKSYPGRY